MRGYVFVFILKLLALSLYLPIAMGLLGLFWDVVIGGLGAYMSDACKPLVNCIVDSSLGFFERPKTWRLLLLLWGANFSIIIVMTRHNIALIINGRHKKNG